MYSCNIFVPAIIVILTSIVTCAFWRFRHKNGTHPSPFGCPIVGNALQISPRTPWITFRDWTKQHGPAYFIKIFGETLLIVNSASMMHYVLVANSSTTSYRPRIPMSQLSGSANVMIMDQPSPRLNTMRRYMNIVLGPGSVQKFASRDESMALSLAKRLASQPQDFVGAIKNTITLALLSIAYGNIAEEEVPKFTKLANDAMHVFNATCNPFELWAVNFFPFLRHLPSWLPGMKFKRQANSWRTGTITRAFEEPFRASIKQMGIGSCVHGLVPSILREVSPDSVDLEAVKRAAGTMYIGR